SSLLQSHTHTCCVYLTLVPSPQFPLFPYTTLFRSEERFFELRGKFCQRHLCLACAADRFVIHVGDVHNAMHLVTAQFEMTLKQRSEEHTSELQSRVDVVCRLLLDIKNISVGMVALE